MSAVAGSAAPERAPIVARALRGDFVETEHRGTIAVATSEAVLLSGVGDVSAVAGLRSAAKPFQLLPVIESGAADHFFFAPEELAILASSHAGRREHVRAVASALAKAGLNESQLQCGAHAPFDADAATLLLKAGDRPSALHNNCSGKHTGMLALARHLKAPLESYLDADHPVQRAIRVSVAAAAGLPEAALGVATDGCSAPTFFLPMVAAATAFARLAAANAGDPRSEALRRVREAMTAHPALVAGPGRFDTLAMSAMPGLCAKGGADGFQGLAVRVPGGNVGIAVKMWDGNGRVARLVAVEALRQALGDIPPALAALGAEDVRNHRGLVVGRLAPAFALTPRTS